MADAGARGRFVWHDLMTTDSKSAISFYTKVAGWGTETWDTGGGPPYTMWTANGTALGGVMDKPAGNGGATPSWIAYVCVPDVDATAKQTVALGGSVYREPTDIPTVGRFAVIGDPQGAAIAVFTPKGKAQGHDGRANLGEFSWHELATTDYKAALEFYTTLFGWERGQAHDMGPLGIYQLFERNGLMIGGMYNKPADMPFPPHWLGYIRVDSADRAAERVTKNGGTILHGPMEVPGGDRVAMCTDPQGGMFAVQSFASA
jgi:predicted enzyme related to lactoylglutathione lyase